MAAAPTVSGVSVSPKTASVQKGGILQFSTAVDGTGLEADPAYRNVAWSITTDGTKTGTSISTSGLLTVAEGETKTSLEIKAVSTVDMGRSDTAQVSVIEAQPSVSSEELADHVAGLSPNTAATPHTVKLKRTNIRQKDVMTLVNEGITSQYVILYLSACYATDNMISGSIMSAISNNQYIVGIILPCELTTIGVSVFDRCSSLASVTFAEGVI
jgi:hypothetical protein